MFAAAGVAFVFEAVIPPTVLFLTVHALDPKLNIPMTSAALDEVDVNVMLPVADWLPIVFPATSPTVVRPLET
jgi:hypothetical protein